MSSRSFCSLLRTDIIPRTISDGTSKTSFASAACGFDAPKVLPINDSTFDWWYFEVVSENQTHLTAKSFLATPGTAFLPSGFPPDAILARFDVPGAALSGSINLRSIAPVHYPSGPARAGENMELLLGAFLNINGTEINLKGNGYYDNKGTISPPGNWGSAPFVDTVASWYWGHRRLGPYSLVWFDATDTSGTEHVAAATSLMATHAVVDIGDAGVLEFDIIYTVAPILQEETHANWRGVLSGGFRSSEVLTGFASYEQFVLPDSRE
ncbi:hypothetical protein GGS23DRAFT_607044 [Durotheca rogersii]|uniref:uncharacterized protein n=1 Tax=Durotheca rogersii TaxID=419775 RepID=UPI00221E3918|nr:uncharacterized protein GGS23DRAFT_607044 [Durotheca rogersii]KAI5860319.1 hypothetical protein GGS23DRAFT_607044 [Durotheca rogersii]